MLKKFGLAFLIAAGLAMSACSAVQISGGVKTALSVDDELREFTIADVQRAHEIAVAQNDTIADQCYSYLLVALPQLGMGDGQNLNAVGVISAFQKARGAVRGFKEATVTDEFIIACSPLYVSARDDVIGIAQMFGTLALPKP